MANRDDNRGFGGRDDWRRERGRWDDRDRGQGREDRSFGERGRYSSDEARYGGSEGEREPWRRDRYGARYDQDRSNYGSGWDRERGEYGRGQDPNQRFGGGAVGRGYGGYGGHPNHGAEGRGQEYGMEARGRDDRWRRDPTGEQRFGEPADYAFRPEGRQEFDADYLHWRDAQMRGHDRDYHEWRGQQHRQYDDEYRQFREQRREHFGRAFHEWRAQRNLTGGVARTDISPGAGGYGTQITGAGGMGSDQTKPAGTPGLNMGATLGQGGAATPSGGGSTDGPSAGSATTGGDFVDTSPQVQAASEGWDTRKPAEDALRDHHKDDEASDKSRH